MPMILNHRRAFLFGRQTGIRSTSEARDQLQSELDRERRQHAFDVAEFEKQITILTRDFAKAQLEIAQRDMVDAFAAAPSPSEMKH